MPGTCWRRRKSELRRDAEDALIAQGASVLASSVRVHVRYEGSDTALPIAYGGIEEMAEAFAQAHARQFGFGFEGGS